MEKCRHEGGDGMCSYCHHKLSLVARQQEARGRKTRERRRDAIEIALYKALLASQHVDKE
jgi:hypothetical protein